MKLKAIFYQNPVGFLAALILLLFAAGSFYYDKDAFLWFVAAFFLVSAVNLLYSVLRFVSVRRSVAALNKSLNGKTGDVAGKFPLPCMLLDKQGQIVWYNDRFNRDIIAENKARQLSAADFFEDFDFYGLMGSPSAPARLDERLFTAFISTVRKPSMPLLCVYLHEDTYYKNTEAEYLASRPFVMQILVDNIEQLSRQLTDSKFALALSGIESRVENWLKDRKLILKKTANGRFVVVGEVRDLAELEKNKFSVLGDVRDYKVEDAGLDPTLSIGVGTGDTFAECEERAKKALDMALGRGGDQAAVYTPDGHVYYGGVSDRQTDNSRVSPRKTSANMATVFKKYETVLIQGHTFSDYDAVGAAVGLQHLCTLCGVRAYTVVDEKTTLAGPLIHYLIGQGYGGFISPREALELCDENVLLASVDVHRPAIFDCPRLAERCGAQIVIDHHRRAEDGITGAEIFYHLPGASSASEMVAELIEYSSVTAHIPTEIATALMAGIVLDTRNFVLRTSQRTFEAAGFLRECGANTVLVKKLFSSSSDMMAAQYRILADAVNHDGFMISGTEEMRDDLRVLTSKTANDMLDIEGVRASFVLSFIKPGEKVQISARSLGEENVQLIMEQLGGGGHSTMAAAQVDCETLAEAKHQLLKAIDAYVKSK